MKNSVIFLQKEGLIACNESTFEIEGSFGKVKLEELLEKFLAENIDRSVTDLPGIYIPRNELEINTIIKEQIESCFVLADYSLMSLKSGVLLRFDRCENFEINIFKILRSTNDAKELANQLNNQKNKLYSKD